MLNGGELADAIDASVEEILSLARTWIGWDGHPRAGEGSTWTPNKALRRVADHMIDHLCQIDALSGGHSAIESTWRGRSVTLDSDWAHFTEGDLNEAENRIRRLARLWRSRLLLFSSEELGRARGGEWSLLEIASHTAGICEYARFVGDLSDRSGTQ
jgi:hypothetical protein